MATGFLFDSLGPDSRSASVSSALAMLAVVEDSERGAVFTRPEVAVALLDLAGYTVDQPLYRRRLLEPSFGAGDILLPALDRLLVAYGQAGGSGDIVADLSAALFAVELHAGSHDRVRSLVAGRLAATGANSDEIEALCNAWLCRDDFLLCTLQGEFDVVVGNPPYVRQERIPAALLAEYRERYRTLFDRADLYVPFFERGLDALASGGVLSFICANRWTKNRYGGPLRQKISERFALRYFIDLEGVDAFQADVIAYPAITVVERPQAVDDGTASSRVASASAVDRYGLPVIAEHLRGGRQTGSVDEINLAGSGDAPWLLEDIPMLRLLRRLESQFPTVEQAGCPVGIGVATGCDRVFIGNYASLPVENARKLPLVMSRDLVDGVIRWQGNGVVNPFEEDGRLADLAAYPAFAAYLDDHREAVMQRHVARRKPAGWYRTIDRIEPSLVARPKLLVPDIKGEAVFVHDQGCFYPHHNLYYLTSNDWDLRALQAVLKSSLSLMFVAAYCTRMAGGFLRFQAQYLRRIRVPNWIDLAHSDRVALATIAERGSVDEIDAIVLPLYGLSADEAQRVRCSAAEARPASRRDRWAA